MDGNKFEEISKLISETVEIIDSIKVEVKEEE